MTVDPGNFIDTEKAKASDDSVRVLWRFVREVPAIGWLLIPSILFSILGTSGNQIFSWLSGAMTSCSSAQNCYVKLPFSFPVFGSQIHLTLLTLSLVGVTLVSLRVLGWILFEVGGQIACVKLFSRMMRSLSSTRSTFFDENPSGRIINRTVRDFDQLRFMGPIRIGDAFNALIELCVIGVVISFAHPLAGLVVVPTLLIFLFIQRNIAPMLQFCIVQRSIRFGEVLHRETDAIEGIRTFLLYGQHPALFRRLKRAMASFTQIHLLRAKIEAWGRFWSTAASAICSFVALVIVAIGLERGSLSTILAAVIITSAFRLAGVFGWLTWSLGYLFETAGHARRIFEYVDLPHEEREEFLIKRPDALRACSIPLSGDLEFIGYAMSYRPNSPIILNNLSLRIPHGAAVGVVGRTGAGKSSLVQALFRMVAVRAGDIRIGGHSIFGLPVEEARRSFAVMPQDPYLFAGSLRDNLDPLKQYSDAALLAQLTESQLLLRLDHKVTEGGSNLSVGQRQLIGLTRVLLSHAPIVIMDEPTSSVDAITDALVQKMIREKLKDRTLITIAHRLGTLNGCDIVVELSNGQVARIGKPSEVLHAIESELEQFGLAKS